MDYTTLTGTDIQMSRLAFGTMRLVSDGADPTTWEEGERALHAAIAAGVNVIHSNSAWPTYPATRSMIEKHPQRGDLHHVIKVESPDYDDAEFDPAVFRRQVETGLRSLHVERIAVVQHLQRGPYCPKEIAYSAEGDERRLAALPRIADQVAEVAEELTAAGKIGQVATFPHTAGFATEALTHDVYGSVVHFFSMLEPEMVPLLDALRDRGKSLIGLRPLTQGLTTDRRADRASLPAGDKRLLDRYSPWYERLEAVWPLVREHDESYARAALRWGWAHEAVATLAVSMNTVNEVETALEAMQAGAFDESVVRAVHERVAALPAIGKETLFG